MTLRPPAPSSAAADGASARRGTARVPWTLRRADEGPAAGESLLGGFTFDGRSLDGLESLPLQPLARGPRAEWWAVDAPVTVGTHGRWRWREGGGWLWASARAREGRLDDLTQAVYGELFELLDARGLPHPQRVWNYLRDINGVDDGLERYRHFNVGRQRAFAVAGRGTHAGAPAACGMGLPAEAGDDLVLAVLASAEPARAIENPRQVSAYDYPVQYGPRSPTFSRAALVHRGAAAPALLISGTASIVGHASLHEGDAAAQVREILVNLQALLQEAQRAGDRARRLDDLTCTLYLRDPADLAPVRAVFEAAVGRDTPAARRAVFLQADICRRDLLVEIEAHAA